MQRKRTIRKSLPGRREFLKSAGAAAAGLYLAGSRAAGRRAGAGRAAKSETLGPQRRHAGGHLPGRSSEPSSSGRSTATAEKEAVKAALDCDSSTIYQYGPKLEAKWREYNQVPFAKTHMNGTSAVTSMFFALDLPPGSEIMVPSYTFFGAILPMRFFGFVPVFVDINPRTATLDVEHAKQVLTPQVPGHHGHALLGPALRNGPHQRLRQGARPDRVGRLRPRPRRLDAGQEGGQLEPHGHLQLPGHQAAAGHRGRHGHLPEPRGFRAGHRLRPLRGVRRVPAGVSPIAAGSLAKDSPYRKYTGTGLGMKLRMHPLAAVLILKQLEDARRAERDHQSARSGNSTTASANCPASPSRSAARTRSGSTTARNMLFLDEKKAGMSRATVVKALAGRGRVGRRRRLPGEPQVRRSTPSRSGGTTRRTCPRSCPAARR